MHWTIETVTDRSSWTFFVFINKTILHVVSKPSSDKKVGLSLPSCLHSKYSYVHIISRLTEQIYRVYICTLPKYFCISIF